MSENDFNVFSVHDFIFSAEEMEVRKKMFMSMCACICLHACVCVCVHVCMLSGAEAIS